MSSVNPFAGNRKLGRRTMRRALLVAPALGLLTFLPLIRWNQAHAQLPPQTMNQLASKTMADLKAAARIEDIPSAVQEWNRRFRLAAATGGKAATDYEKIVDAVSDELKSEAMKAFLDKALPSLAKIFDLVPGWLSPVLAFLDASAPSSIAKDFQELSLLNDLVQAEATKAAARFLPPGWNTAIINQIKLQNVQIGPSIGPR